MFNRLGKKHVLGALAALLILGAAGAALAYFTGSTGTGTGSASVGSSSQWSVTVNTAGSTFSGGLAAIYPGDGTETIPFTVTNNGNGNQDLASLTPTIVTDSANGYAEDTSGNDITGCLANWFVPVLDSSNAALPDDVAHNGGTYTGNVKLTMTDDTTHSQDACQGQQPAVTVAASS